MSAAQIIYRGEAGDVFAASNSVSGNVSENGETWDVSLAGTKQAIKEYISNRANIFIGSSWTPIPIPSRNTPRISGWTVSYSGNVASLRISYQFDPLTTYKSASAETLPPETKTESISSSTTSVSLQDCPGIWTAEQFKEEYSRVRAVFVDYAKARKGIKPSSKNYEALVAEWEGNFVADLLALGQEGVSAPWENQSFIRISKMLANGQDLYNATAYQITITERLNARPELKGINTYNAPPVEKLTLPNDKGSAFWYQSGDALSTIENGQFQRTRTWLGVSVKSPLYETLAEA